MQLKPFQEIRLQGIPISDGIALAKVCLFNEARHADLPSYQVDAVNAEAERQRILRAIDSATRQLEQLKSDVEKRIGAAEAEIFAAHIMILQDPETLRQMLEAVTIHGVNAESAITETLNAVESQIMELDDEYLRERASDFGEVKRRLLDHLGNIKPTLLCHGQPHCQKGHNRIIVAEELTPTLTLELDTDHTRGFVTERGGKTSHAAILARSLGIPAVTGIKGLYAAISCGTELLLNGTTGEIVVWPGPATKADAETQISVIPDETDTRPIPGFQVLANINTVQDIAGVRAVGAEGIGLYRTEFEFFAVNRLLSEDEQYERYSQLLRAMQGQPVTIRLLDIGGDKEAPYFNVAKEDNPYLGFRGARLLLQRDDLLIPQVRALARAARHGPIQMLYPMIVDLDQFLALRKKIEQAIQDLPANQLSHGIMLEVPSACLMARELMAAADFASIGSNDLIQYLFAVDRNNALVSRDYTPDHPLFWKIISDLARIAAELQQPLSICGELAGDPAYIAQLIQCGINSVSVSTRLIPRTRQAARQTLETQADTKKRILHPQNS